MEKKTLSKIDSTLARIRMHPEYSLGVARKSLEHMREEASRHSSAIEAESGQYSTTRDIEKFKAEAYKRLVLAKDFLKKEGISLFSLSALGNLLEPDSNEIKNFRMSSINFGEFEGANWQEIPYKIHDLIEQTKDSSIHPVTLAINAHATIINVHPYKDGNGRAARLFQDYFLESRAYPSAIIPVTDRALYIFLMNGLLRDRRANQSSVYEPSEREGLFNAFIESKVLASSERLEDELKKRRAYTLNFSGVTSPGLTRKIKHQLIGFNGNGLEVHIENTAKPKSAEFSILGDISSEELKERVEYIAKKYDLKGNLASKLDDGNLNYHQLGKLNERARITSAL